MRSLFTTADILSFFKQIFDNKEFVNEKIILFENGEQKETDITDYLNIDLYSWKDRIAETDKYTMQETPLETYIQQLNESVGKIIGLVEYTDNSSTISQDIDSATIMGKITFLADSNKITELDYFISKLRNLLLGNPQEIINRNGDKIKAYINMGILVYDEEPTNLQIGETIVCTANFQILYLNNALSYNDFCIKVSFNNEKFYELPFIRSTWQKICTNEPLARQGRPDLTGFRNSAISNTETIAFYDLADNEFLKELNHLFWLYGAISHNGKPTTLNEVNKYIYIQISTNSNTYVYREIIDNIQKVITNNEFVITSITLKGGGVV